MNLIKITSNTTAIDSVIIIPTNAWFDINCNNGCSLLFMIGNIGESVGTCVGTFDGTIVGILDGACDGLVTGTWVGWNDGIYDG